MPAILRRDEKDKCFYHLYYSCSGVTAPLYACSFHADNLQDILGDGDLWWGEMLPGEEVEVDFSLERSF
jgi:hypothetical protein